MKERLLSIMVDPLVVPDLFNMTTIMKNISSVVRHYEYNFMLLGNGFVQRSIKANLSREKNLESYVKRMLVIKSANTPEKITLSSLHHMNSKNCHGVDFLFFTKDKPWFARVERACMNNMGRTEYRELVMGSKIRFIIARQDNLPLVIGMH